MKLNIIDSVCDQGDKTNDDRVGFTDNAAWVIDGATGLNARRLLTKGGSDAAWLTDRMDNFLQDRVTEFGSVPQMLRDMGRALMKDFQKDRADFDDDETIEPPSAALNLLMLRPDCVHVNIGDCRLIARYSDGKALSFGTSYNNVLDRKLTEELTRLQAGNDKPIGALWQELLPLIKINRGYKNTQGGYGVVEPSLAWQPFAQYGFNIARPGMRLLIMSDGFSRLLDTYHVHKTDRALLKAACEQGLKALVHELRVIERGDPDCRRYPRLKPQDDASAILLEVVRPLAASPLRTSP